MPELFVHGLLDGRDTPPRSAEGFLPDLAGRLSVAHPRARIATIGGRYFAMDRDQRWERVEKGYDAIVHASGLHARSVDEALTAAYARGESDEDIDALYGTRVHHSDERIVERPDVRIAARFHQGNRDMDGVHASPLTYIRRDILTDADDGVGATEDVSLGSIGDRTVRTKRYCDRGAHQMHDAGFRGANREVEEKLARIVS